MPTPSLRQARSARAAVATVISLAALGAGPGTALAVPTFTITAPAPVTEGANAVFTVTCAEQAFNDCALVSASVAFNDGTATAPADYTDASAQLLFGGPGPPILGGGSLTVATIDDAVGENPETFTAVLSSAASGALISGSPATATINDNDGGLPNPGGGGTAGGADLYILKVESADPVQVGTEFGYTIGVYNFGPTAAQNVTVSDPLPGGVQFVSATPSQGSCSGTSQVACNLLSINPGATHYIRIRVRATSEGVIQNTAAVTSSTADPVMGNNSATTLTQAFSGGVAPSGIPNPGGATIAALRGSRTCVWSDGNCVVIVDCISLEQNCTAVGRGQVLVSGGAAASAVHRFRRVRRTVAAGEEEKLTFRVGARQRRAVGRALRRGRLVRAKVKVTVTDPVGNRTVRRRNLKLVR